MVRVLITGITSLRNRGVEALLASTTAELRRRSPDLPICVLLTGGDQDFARLQAHGVEAVGPGSRPSRKLVRDPRLTARVGRLLSRTVARLSRETARGRVEEGAAIVIASGGDIFSSHYGGLAKHLQPLERALRAGVPVVFLAQSIGPFDTPEEARMWSDVAVRASLVTIREAVSYDYVVRQLGLPERLVHLTADPAFLLALPEATRLAELRDAYRLGEGPVVAVCPSQVIARLGLVHPERHLETWLALVRYIRDDIGARVLVISHVQGVAEHSDDSLLAARLLQRLGKDPGISAAAGYTASEFKGLISGCAMLITERMHPAIAGLSTGTPTVAVRYSIKADGIMLQAMGQELGRELLIRVEAFIDPSTAIRASQAAWDRRSEVAAVLAARIPDVQALAARNFELIEELMPKS